MIAVGLFSWFALLYLILAILIWQDYRNDKILQELKRSDKIMIKKHEDYVYIKDTLTNLLEAGYNIPMIETVLEQIKAEAASKIVKSYRKE